MAKAHEVMVNPVFTVSEDNTVQTVLKTFVEHRISGVPVINAKNEPVGFISDGDIMAYIGYHDSIVFFFDITSYTSTWVETESLEEKIKELNKLNVMKIATKQVISVQFDEDLDKVARILGNKKIKKVPVVKNKELVGVISRGDIIRFVVNNYLTP
ncbi:MAG: Inosine-5'-monophosphate dehydrogenase [Candidatus Dichloromethanomonas elyunquensis]|nr:MAG: Inosine-5'-monophosphate dehydrogenase [Candidatus Dichloromethanomonas elyunquensis]